MRIGLTMDVHWRVGDDRPCDSLDRDWAFFMKEALPEVSWVPVPNLGPEGARAFVEAMDISGLIFTDGASLGKDQARDETELSLLDFALRAALPVFGIGRGMLLFQTRFGGRLEPGKGHAALEHMVYLSRPPFLRHPYKEITVNSLHKANINKLAPGLLPFAVDRKGGVEGAFHEQHRLAGVLWSPEKEDAPSAGFDRLLLQAFFRTER